MLESGTVTDAAKLSSYVTLCGRFKLSRDFFVRDAPMAFYRRVCRVERRSFLIRNGLWPGISQAGQSSLRATVRQPPTGPHRVGGSFRAHTDGCHSSRVLLVQRYLTSKEKRIRFPGSASVRS